MVRTKDVGINEYEINNWFDIIKLTWELYQINPVYFKHCFFNMYYQIKKKNSVDIKCHGDKDKIKKVWKTLYEFQRLVNIKKESKELACSKACRKYGIEQSLLHSLIGSFNALKGHKKTRFKFLKD